MTGALDRYLASLPEGFRSFPQAKVKGNVLDEQLEWLESLGGRVDPRIAGQLRKVRPLGRTLEWVPEVLSAAVSVSTRDHYPDDDAWCRGLYEIQRGVYQRPLYRALMMVLSPTLLTMGAGDRWKAYRRGSSLSVDRWKRGTGLSATTGTLEYPAGLYTPMMLRGTCETLRAAIDAAGAKDSAVEVLGDETIPGLARFRMTYRT